MKKIIDYIDQIQEEADKGADINVLFWVGTNTIKKMLEDTKNSKSNTSVNYD